jgi:hypothetical protein
MDRKRTPKVSSLDVIRIGEFCQESSPCRHTVWINEVPYGLNGRQIWALLVEADQTDHPDYPHFVRYR